MSSHSVLLAILAVLLLLITGFGIALFRSWWTGPSRVRNAAMNFSIALVSLSVLGLVSELYFFTLGVRSDGFAFTLATQRWRSLNWTLMNSRGYRDLEYDSDDFARFKSCAVVGDSFAVGAGIANYRHRFASVLADHLGDDWIVPVIAHGGWSTDAQLEALRDYPHAPDVVVLQYYMNDIQPYARKRGLKSNTSKAERPEGFVGYLTRHSYLFDRVYWSVHRVRLQRSNESFWDQTKEHYSDQAVWEDHRRDLLEFAAYVRSQKWKLLVLIIPDLNRIEESASIAEKVANVFASVDVPVLDITPRLAEWGPARSMTVNALNAHANEAVSRDIGRWLYDELVAQNLLEAAPDE